MASPNMELLRPSRNKPRPGDIFVMRYRDVGYIFGRVIRVNPLDHAWMPKCNLIYIYRPNSPVPDPNLVTLSRYDLLIPPAFVNRLPWSRGYFETVERRPLQEGDAFDRHCFDYSRFRKIEFVDENGVTVDGPFEPCGVWGLDSYASLDDTISDALGVPRAPE